MKKSKKKKSHVTVRLNLLFFIIFLMFAMLILRLGVIQIVHGEDAKREIERTEDITVNKAVPRGKIFDRNYRPVVDNEAKRAITYTIPNKFNQKKTLELAEELAELIDQDTDKITERDKIDFWILKNPKEAKKKVTKAEIEKYKGKDNELYKLQRERVTEEELQSLTKKDLEVLAIYRELTSGYALTPQLIKNEDVTTEEYAKVSERLSQLALPGVDTTVDWERNYLYDETLQSILGGVTEGLPQENLDYYMSRGYNRSDRVGRSYIELQYEDFLRGQKEKVKNVTRSGKVVETKLIHEGERGKDLVLTIDMELQQAVDKIIEEELRRAKGRAGTAMLDRAFVVLMDPFTGEVLTLSGKQYRNGKFSDFAAGNFTTSYTPGSVVKGATVLTGFMTGVNKPGQPILDEPLYIPPNKISSHFNRGGNNIYLTDRQALVRSSNIYMAKTAIAIGDGQYSRGRPLKINKEKAFRVLREHFAQFGLGVPTGIDLPNETTGIKPPIDTAHAGNALHLSFGQYDTYTPLQLAQYVSTIANGGYRMKPHILKEIREPAEGSEDIGPIAQEIQPKVLNRINASEDLVKHVQSGFWGVFHDPRGTGRVFNTAPYNQYQAAGKTGTAESVDNGVGVWNLGLVAYAPYEHPEIAMAVVVPSAYTKGGAPNSLNMDIGKRVIQTYFELKKKSTSNEEEKE